ncbi:MAG: hypothetical protein IT385_01675 [Deltaproteobacteria bacterium]|nr:hypothetical protein [Deltaproteobacteria bacterium]
MRRALGGMCVVAVALTPSLGAGGCDGGLSDLATFIDSPFGDITDNVRDLDEPGVELVMNELMRRFRAYVALREALPFEAIAPDVCIANLTTTDTRISFSAEVACMLEGVTTPLSGEVRVAQAQLASTPVGVFRFDLDYRLVVVGALSVSGTERITETQGADGASVRKLDLVQDGEDFAYEFRVGLVDGETPVFDYQIPGPDGDVVARITNPTTVGGLVSVFLSGLDGTLQCEVRNTDLARPPRGTCDNGVVFGLPD